MTPASRATKIKASLLFIGGLLLLSLINSPCWAQNILVGDKEEQECLSNYDNGKPIRAAEQARAILEEKESFIATFVLGDVYYWYDANYPRSYFLLSQAEELLFEEFGSPPRDELAKTWHRRLLRTQQYALGEMDDREGELAIIDYYNDLYDPDLEVEKMWPLVKLGQFDEAEEIGKRLIYDSDENIQLRAYNGLMASSDEQRNRDGVYQWGKTAYEITRGDSCVIASNFSRSAWQNLHYEEAVEAIQSALNAGNQDCSSNPLADLASVYLIQGKFQQSIAALKELSQAPTERRLRVQFGMAHKARLAELLLALGQIEEAQKRAIEIDSNPDRVGKTSASQEAATLSATLLYWTIMQAVNEREAERRAARPFATALGIWSDGIGRSLTQWEKSRIAIRLASQQDLLTTMVRPYFLDVMPWYSGTLCEIFGTGLVRKAVQAAREQEQDFETDVGPFFDALEGESYWRDGDDEAAKPLVDAALDDLPEATRILRWRLEAIRTDIAYRAGEGESAYQGYVGLVSEFPSVFRLLGLSLPVGVERCQGTHCEWAAEAIGNSPRFVVDTESPLVMTVTEEASQLSICLKNRRGTSYACAQGEVDDDDLEESVAVLMDEALDTIFSPKIELTQSEIRSLDGRPSRINAERAVEDVLGGAL